MKSEIFTCCLPSFGGQNVKLMCQHLDQLKEGKETVNIGSLVKPRFIPPKVSYVHAVSYRFE